MALTALPGMQSMMTMMKKMADKGVAGSRLRELCQEAEVRLIACQMTVDLFDMIHLILSMASNLPVLPLSRPLPASRISAYISDAPAHFQL